MSKFNRAVVAVIGCGGTGSYLCDHIGRLFGASGELRFMNQPLLMLIDADVVSSTNTVRQNFSYTDINEQKGLVLKRKLQQQYNVQSVDFWASFANKRLLERLLKKTGTQPLIIVSCVDNHRTRNRVMSFLKPDPDSYTGARETDWLYLDAGNAINDGWSSAMGVYSGQSFGTDFRMQDAALRSDSVDEAPTLTNDGREREGCGAVTSSPLTYWGNQTNAMLLGSQLRSICMYGKGYGVLAWQRSDFNSDSWQSESYQNHFLAPFEIT